MLTPLTVCSNPYHSFMSRILGLGSFFQAVKTLIIKSLSIQGLQQRQEKLAHPVWVGPSPRTPQGVRWRWGALHTEWEVGAQPSHRPPWCTRRVGSKPPGPLLVDGTSSVSHCYCCHCGCYCTVATASGTWQSPGTPAPQGAGLATSLPLGAAGSGEDWG